MCSSVCSIVGRGVRGLFGGGSGGGWAGVGVDVSSLAVCMVCEWLAGLVVWQGVESGFSVLA